MNEARRETLVLPLPAGGGLHGVWMGPASAEFAVVFVHGFGSIHWGEKSQALAAACARRGWAFAAIDFRGHGQSSGQIHQMRGSSLLDDLDTLYTHLHTRGVRQLFLVGSSLGGWASAWWTLRHPAIVPATVLIAPALTFPRLLLDRLPGEVQAVWQKQRRLRLRNAWIDVDLDYDVIDDARHYPLDRLVADWRTPVLLLHGMQDEVVPYEETLDVVQRWTNVPAELRLYRQGDHRLSDYREEIAEAACQFFARPR